MRSELTETERDTWIALGDQARIIATRLAWRHKRVDLIEIIEGCGRGCDREVVQTSSPDAPARDTSADSNRCVFTVPGEMRGKTDNARW